MIETSAWYALAYWLGGAWAVLIYAVLCSGVIFSMKIINYVQHYGLKRIRLPNGRYERVQPWHSWSAAYRLSNWFFYNMQRHPDHHTAPNRRYPLLQHCGADEAPQLPGSYVEMAGLALFPGRWFKKMDPLVDQWRQRFYPRIDDWSAYDSAATAARPDAFEAISEIFGASPRLAKWINRASELLDSLLFAPVPRDRDHERARKLAGFRNQYLTSEAAEELAELTRARCVFTSGDSSIGKQFEQARQEILAHDAVRDKRD